MIRLRSKIRIYYYEWTSAPILLSIHSIERELNQTKGGIYGKHIWLHPRQQPGSE